MLGKCPLHKSDALLCTYSAADNQPDSNHCNVAQAEDACPDSILVPTGNQHPGWEMPEKSSLPVRNLEFGKIAFGCTLDLITCQLLDVRDVIPWVTVERLLQPQLVKVVANETNGAAQHEQAVEAPERHEVVALLAGECSARADHVHEGHGDATIHVQDEVRALAGCQLLHFQSKVQHRCALEVHLCIFLDDHHAL